MTNIDIQTREELRIILHQGLDRLSTQEPIDVKEAICLALEHWQLNSPERAERNAA